MSRILVVEDNANLALGLRNNLEIEGYEVEIAEDGAKGLELARSWRPDLVILDLMLPGMSGLQVLKSIRRDGATVPVLILTARGEEADKVLGLKLGADDYVTKPFGLLELLARVEAMLRWPKRFEVAADSWRFGDVEVRCGSRTVTRNGSPVALSPKEFDLLEALVKREGRVASRVELMEEVWGYASSVVSRTVDTHIGELRRKLEEDPSDPRFILTVRKVGYRVRAERSE